MSVLIKGFEMPKDGCKDCVMVYRGNIFDICPFLKQEVNENVEFGGKPDECPLIDVPDTNVGDTISRQAAIDALISFFGLSPEEEYGSAVIEVLNGLSPAQPEVIACGSGELVAQAEWTKLKQEFLRMASYIDVLLECSNEQKETLLGFISRIAEFMPWTERD